MNISTEVECIPDCIICGKQSNLDDVNFVNNLGLKKRYSVKVCENCELRWLSPRPTAEAYNDLYSNQNYLSSVESYSTLAEKRAPYFRARIKKIEKYFNNINNLQILELGAATGEFINEAKLLGHNAIGIEPSIESRNVAKSLYGIELIDSSLDKFPDQEFDVIHMNHVFEHLLNPVAVLSECVRLLKKNGILVLEVPQQFYNDLDRLKKFIKLKKKPEFDYYSLHHTFFYTPRSLKNLMRKEGFRIDYLVTSNAKRTPLKPFNISNLVLLIFLWLSDKIHSGGNIIEVYARKD